jgi:hypothetical protein
MSEETITLTLKKEDIINLVLAVAPHYNLFKDESIINSGEYTDNLGWKWDTHHLKTLDINNLLLMYLKCKKSWK